MISPLTIAAQFAAFTWFTGNPQTADRSHDEAMRFARDNWEAFLPLAHRGLGRLLLKLADTPKRCSRRRPEASVSGSAPKPAAAPISAVDRPFSCN